MRLTAIPTPGHSKFHAALRYVAAELQETHLWANVTRACHCIDPAHDQVIFHDNDFEVCAVLLKFELLLSFCCRCLLTQMAATRFTRSSK